MRTKPHRLGERARMSLTHTCSAVAPLCLYRPIIDSRFLITYSAIRSNVREPGVCVHKMPSTRVVFIFKHVIKIRKTTLARGGDFYPGQPEVMHAVRSTQLLFGFINCLPLVSIAVDND